jgi:hypothetical protein
VGSHENALVDSLPHPTGSASRNGFLLVGLYSS